jgi:hypothetical protein
MDCSNGAVRLLQGPLIIAIIEDRGWPQRDWARKMVERIASSKMA